MTASRRRALGVSAWAAFLGTAFHSPAARADLIFGLNSAPSGGGIYLIDTATRASTLYRSGPIAASGQCNGLAYDSANDTFYYVNRVGTRNRLIRNGPGSVEVDLGTMSTSGILNSATFHAGSYWAQANSSPGITRVNFVGPGFSDFFVPIAGYPGNVNYGDIASQSNGITFASQSSGMRRYDLNSPATPSVPLVGANISSMQLAFGPSGLFGLRGTTLYSVNTTTGFASSIGNLLNTRLGIVDLATAPTPSAGLVLACGLPAVTRRRRTPVDRVH